MKPDNIKALILKTYEEHVLHPPSRAYQGMYRVRLVSKLRSIDPAVPTGTWLRFIKELVSEGRFKSDTFPGSNKVRLTYVSPEQEEAELRRQQERTHKRKRAQQIAEHLREIGVDVLNSTSGDGYIELSAASLAKVLLSIPAGQDTGQNGKWRTGTWPTSGASGKTSFHEHHKGDFSVWSRVRHVGLVLGYIEKALDRKIDRSSVVVCRWGHGSLELVPTIAPPFGHPKLARDLMSSPDIEDIAGEGYVNLPAAFEAGSPGYEISFTSPGSDGDRMNVVWISKALNDSDLFSGQTFVIDRFDGKTTIHGPQKRQADWWPN